MLKEMLSRPGADQARASNGRIIHMVFSLIMKTMYGSVEVDSNDHQVLKFRPDGTFLFKSEKPE